VTDLSQRAVSLVGLFAMIALAWLFSENRRRVPWRTIAWGVGIQLTLGVLLLRAAPGRMFFVAVNEAVNAFIGFTDEGVRFVFGSLATGGFSFAVQVLPIIVVMGSLFAVLYHLGIVQRVVDLLAAALARSLRTSGAETLAAVANIFVGMSEAPLLVRPYVERMTRSELFCVMTTGMATVAGSVLLAYVKMLGGGEFGGHLVVASLLSAPAAILLAKVIVPELEEPETAARRHALVERRSVNVIDAASIGAIDGLRLAAYVGAMLVAFVALIHMLNAGIESVGGWFGIEGLTLQVIFGVVLAPIAWLMGIAWQDAQTVGALLGIKTVLNEFLAYQQLAEAIQQGLVSPRSAVIASYALCGFANFGSLAILLGALGGMAPSRRPELARLGLRSILSGSLAAFMTACVAGILL
jgi:CNT family concentrative nucleoside transporter